MEEKKVAEQKPQVPVQVRSKKWILGLIGGVFFVLVALVVFLPQPYYAEGFKTLSELQEYAQTIDENIKTDWDNVVIPSYESYYQKSFGPSLFRTCKEKLKGFFYYCGLYRRPLFSPSFFKAILSDVTQERQNNGWIGEFVQKIEVQPDSKIVVFGAVQGAFHPLVRYLEKLKELNVIDENLVIKNPNDYIVFLGNVINRSPYTLEILSIVLRLLKQNPENVIYLKGVNEFFDYWKKHTFYRELELRIQPLFDNKEIMIDYVHSFFNTLPLTLYSAMSFWQDTSGKLNYFKLRPFIQDEYVGKVRDEFYQSFLKQKMQKNIDSFNIVNVDVVRKDNDGVILIRSIIQDIRKRDSYEKMDGLRLLESEGGATVWTVLSTSAEPYRLAFDFFYDAFAIVFPAQNLKDWKITLFKRDIRNKEKNFEQRSEHFFQY